MKVLLPYFLIVFLLGARAEHRGARSRAWVLALTSVVVGAIFYSPRFL